MSVVVSVCEGNAQVRAGQDPEDDVSLPLYLGNTLAPAYQDSKPDQTPEEHDSISSDTPDRASRESPVRSAGTEQITLSANQIFGLIHQHQEIAVDLKHVTASFLLDRGIAVQEDSITDEILFSNLASNANLRRAVSIWLRARGYLDGRELSSTPSELSDLDNHQFESQPDILAPRYTERDKTQDLLSLPKDSELVPQDPYALQDPDLTLAPSRAPHQESLRGLTASAPPQQSELRVLKQGDRANEPDVPELLHVPAPYNLQSLRDLYTQLPEPPAPVHFFGSDLFDPHVSPELHAGRQIPIDLPIGPDYVLGPGDGVTISVWGSLSQSFTRTVSPDGTLVLPEAGAIQVAGLTLARAEALIQHSLAGQFRDARVLVSIAHLRTIRIYVVGDVAHPGAYDISSLSTTLNALYAAGGPTEAGSLRRVRHMRGQQLVREIDFYDFLQNGIRTDTERLASGDTILVPPVGATATVSGMVKRPAIYELKASETLSQVIAEAGGLRPDASAAHIRIERIEANGNRMTTEIKPPHDVGSAPSDESMDNFAVRDGDRIFVAPVLPYSHAVIYTAGHFPRPGRKPFREGMTLADVIHSFQDLLPEPANDGEIIRLMPPDRHPEAIQFSLREVINGGQSAVQLRPFDTILVRGRYDADAPRVTVRGDVIRPGSYALTDGMTAGQLVRLAGGFKRSALLKNADLASYQTDDNSHVISEHRTIAIGAAVLQTNTGSDVKLHPGDILTIHQIPGWSDVGASVTLLGEVVYPGTYGLGDGETLSSIIRRAGGFRRTAYPEGAVMIRQQVKQFELRSRSELIRQIETVSAGARLGSAGTDTGSLQLLVQQQNQILQRLRREPVIGRLVINISPDITQWEATPADIQVRAGDVISIPKRPGFVLVTGQSYNTSAISYMPGKDAKWYLRHAGGATDMANRKEIYVIRANGDVVGRRSGDWHQNVLSTRLNPGDVVVVPQKIVGGSAVWKNTLAAAQVVSSIAFTAALALR